ncbi:sirohydrochlorin ferrochelatase [Promicromonospora sp. AC04]|uniref:sirohydrochlorin chelatase n=1 Tax=Promicromonospora sp. AC04 TaxID=2135723 RepID=UPI000D38949F|nr:CbiX/SirB N-terminal domain-containing protein [Promicromonospora sp. AC04]PUB28974.1 sirohydrochlorin ferrochelatase [Promicromonospora sp. AC04]
MAAILIGTSHGTDDPAGQAAVRALLDGVRAARPELDVREAFVDVQQPEVGEVLAGAVRDAGAVGAGAASSDGGPAAVVVPLLLSTGYHVRHDIAQAVAAVNAAGAPGGSAPGGGAADRSAAGGADAVGADAVAPDAAGGGRIAVAAEPLGPHPLLVEILADRYAAAEAAHGPFRSDDAVVLAAAGSSVAAAATAVEEVTSALAQRLGRAVTPSYGAGAEPRVPAAVAAARAGVPGAPGAPGVPGAARVIVVSYLLAPGYFLDRVLEAGADVVTDPVAGPAEADKADPRLVQVVLDRYDAAVSS